MFGHLCRHASFLNHDSDHLCLFGADRLTASTGKPPSGGLGTVHAPGRRLEDLEAEVRRRLDPMFVSKALREMV